MTSRERTAAAIAHLETDRVPVGLRFAPEAMAKFKAYMKMDEETLWGWIGQDMVTVRPKYKRPASDRYYADPTIEVDEKGYYYDIYKVPFRIVENAYQTYMEYINEPPLGNTNTLRELADYPWPTTDAWDYSGIYDSLVLNREKAAWARSRGFFAIAQFMRGFDVFLINLALEPDYACCLMDHILDFVMADARLTLEAGKGEYTFIEYNDDVAFQTGMMISPEMWRNYVKPRMARFCNMVHGFGTKVRYHSCGSIYEIIPDLIEIGVDILNPIQPLAQGMDPFRLKKDFGDRLCFDGGIDIQQILPNAAPADVYRHVREMVEVMGENGGYILAGSHTLQADIPPENIAAMIEAAVYRSGG